MTTEEIARLESALEISVPTAYRRVMTTFPLPAYAGKAWPRRFFALGQDAGGCSDALDLDDPEFGVFWFDRQHLEIADDVRSPEKIEQWLTRQVRDLSSDLAGEGIDPMASLEVRKKAEQKEYRSTNFAVLFFISVVGARTSRQSQWSSVTLGTQIA